MKIQAGRSLCYMSLKYNYRYKTIREDIYKLIFDEYSVESEFPWNDAPDACIFRHYDNRKRRFL